MRFTPKVWLSGLFGIVVIISLIGFGSFSGAQPLSQTATGTPTTGTSGGASGSSGASGSTTMTYPLCTATGGASATQSAMSPGGVSAAPTMMATTTANTSNSSATMSAAQSISTGGPVFLGVAATAVDNCGILVGSVVPGSAAASANLQVGDVIVAVNGRAVTSIMNGSASSGTGTSGGMATAAATTAMPLPGANGTASIQPFATFIQNFQAGQTITLTIQRNGQQMDISVTLGTMPSGLSTGGASGGPINNTLVPSASATVSQ